MSRIRSEVTSRSNWANDNNTLSVSRPIDVVVFELLGDGDERDVVLIEKFDQLGKIGERTGQAIDLVDDDDVDLAGADIVQQTLEGRAVGIATGEAAIVIFGPDQGPAGMGLTADIGLRGIILGIEGVEVVLQPLFGRDPGIDRAANLL